MHNFSELKDIDEPYENFIRKAINNQQSSTITFGHPTNRNSNRANIFSRRVNDSPKMIFKNENEQLTLNLLKKDLGQTPDQNREDHSGSKEHLEKRNNIYTNRTYYNAPSKINRNDLNQVNMMGKRNSRQFKGT